MQLWAILSEPWTFEFLQVAAAMALGLGVLSGMTGTIIVIQRSAMQVESFAHALLPGLILSYLWFGRSLFSLIVGGVLSLTLTRLLSLIFSSHRRIDTNTGSAIVIAFNFSVGLVLLSLYREQLPIALDHFVLGDLLAVSWAETALVWGIVVLCGGLLWLFYAPLKGFLLDPVYAQRRGWPQHATVIVLQLAIVTAALLSFQAVGFVLTLALLTIPAATIQLFAKHLWQMLVMGGVLGAIEGLAGLTFSYYLNWPSAPTIIILAVGVYSLALAWHFWQWPGRTPVAKPFA